MLSAHEAAGGKEVFDKAAAWAAEALNDKVLDATVDEQGAVSFTLLPQAA